MRNNLPISGSAEERSASSVVELLICSPSLATEDVLSL